MCVKLNLTFADSCKRDAKSLLIYSPIENFNFHEVNLTIRYIPFF